MDFFQHWRCLSSNPSIKLLWSFIFPYVSCGTWKERNNRVFRESSLPPNVIAEKICKAISENVNMVFIVGSLYSSNLINDFEFFVLRNGDWFFLNVIDRGIRLEITVCGISLLQIGLKLILMGQLTAIMGWLGVGE